MLLQEVPSLYTMTTASNPVVLKLPTVKECFPLPLPNPSQTQTFTKHRIAHLDVNVNVNLLHSLKAQLPLFHFAYHRVVKNSTQTSTDAHATRSAALHLLSLSFLSFISLGCKWSIKFSPPFLTFQPLRSAPPPHVNCPLSLS